MWHKFGESPSLLSIFLSFVTVPLITTILLNSEEALWIVHHYAYNNSLSVSVAKVYEVLALQIYLIGQQNAPKLTRAKFSSLDDRPLRIDILNAMTFLEEATGSKLIGCEAFETFFLRFLVCSTFYGTLSANFLSTRDTARNLLFNYIFMLKLRLLKNHTK
jgi:hypothetical protein